MAGIVGGGIRPSATPTDPRESVQLGHWDGNSFGAIKIRFQFRGETDDSGLEQRLGRRSTMVSICRVLGLSADDLTRRPASFASSVSHACTQPKRKKTGKFAAVKRMLNPKDARLYVCASARAFVRCPGWHLTQLPARCCRKGNKEKKQKVEKFRGEVVREVKKAPSELFFSYNTSLGPPYHILVDTNFINFAIQNKLDVFTSFMDCLLAKCVPIITDCVMAELEKLGPKYRIALRIAKDPRFERLPCQHKGTYADDCLVTCRSTAVTSWRRAIRTSSAGFERFLGCR